MIKENNLVRWTIQGDTMCVMQEHARMKCLGLGSRIRGRKFTKEELFEWQLIGVLCTYAGIRLITGSDELYHQHMRETGSNPVGDGGTDIPGARVDIKGSLMRRSKNPLSYRLLIRPREFHENTTYILALVDEMAPSGANGYIVGFMDSSEILDVSVTDPTFGDARVVAANLLNPVMNCRWG